MVDLFSSRLRIRVRLLSILDRLPRRVPHNAKKYVPIVG